MGQSWWAIFYDHLEIFCNSGKYSKIKISKFCGYRHEALGPPFPLRVHFCENKINPHFFLEIESMIAKTNFTLGPIEKSIFLVQL